MILRKVVVCTTAFFGFPASHGRGHPATGHGHGHRATANGQPAMATATQPPATQPRHKLQALSTVGNIDTEIQEQQVTLLTEAEN